jgi:aspartate aminotransferase
LSPPGGAFYGFIGCARLIGARTPSGATLTDDAAIARYLLETGHVSTVPGAAYGLSPFVRISTATSEPVLTEAVSRIAAAVGQLQLRNAA